MVVPSAVSTTHVSQGKLLGANGRNVRCPSPGKVVSLPCSPNPRRISQRMSVSVAPRRQLGQLDGELPAVGAAVDRILRRLQQ